ncbi:hypothetical protein M422DRAFT_29936 [Sphaerobolus stellatus SS14]|uniref:Cytochrome P450 n=1 Tax=Sphaerobolus stellatus (strain SS14) TaxID=990650 RepID=A0A0C9W275_SPHS4|nr:hypothetical protein M422DRAFT_29936 [Sphaerobolus stellatus SS14]
MFSLFLTSHHLLVRALLDVCAGYLLVLIARILYTQIRTAYHLRNVPGPKAPSWLWGSEWDLHKASPGVRYLEWKAKHGDVIKIQGALGRNLLAVSDPRAAKFILEENVFDFPKPQGVREWFRLLVGEGLLFVEGKEAHARERRIFTPALTTNAIRPILATFYALSSKMTDAWSARLDSTSSDAIIEDIQWWTNRLSLDNIGLAGFSYSFDSLSSSSEANPLAIALEALTNSADNFSSFVMKALFYTFPWILSIPSEKSKHINNTREELGKVATRMWNQAKEEGADTGRKTLMDSMIKADGADEMTQEQIAAQLRTLVQAGYETVGCTMAWLIYEIARHPMVQSRIREEVTATPNEPTFEDLHGAEHMPFLDATIKETLRLHPPVLELTHVAAKDTLVPLSKPLPNDPFGKLDMLIPKGTIINVPVNLVQADPDVWGRDAALFKPERWLSNNNSEKGMRDVLAFSAGPRICPGRHFAMLEMKATIALVLRQFTLRPVPTKPIEPFWSFVVRPRVRGEKDSSLPVLVERIKY